MRRIFAIAALIVFASMPLSAHAAFMRAGDVFLLEEGEFVEENAYIAGADIRVDGSITGDLAVAGSEVVISGDVSDDVHVAGAFIHIRGPVGDDVRAAGSTITIENTVGGEVVVAGASVRILPEAEIFGDLIVVGAATVSIEGTVRGDVSAQAGDVLIRGEVLGDVNARLDRLAVGPNARISGDVTYRSPVSAIISPEAEVLGAMVFEQLRDQRTMENLFVGLVTTVIGIVTLVLLLIGVVTGLLLTSWFPKATERIVKKTIGEFTMNVMTGIIVFIGVPALVFALFASVIGAAFGALAFLAYWALLLLSKIYAGIVFGSLLFLFLKPQRTTSGKRRKKKKIEVHLETAVIGILALFFISLIPLVGWVVDVVMVLATLGSLSMLVYEMVWLKRT